MRRFRTDENVGSRRTFRVGVYFVIFVLLVASVAIFLSTRIASRTTTLSTANSSSFVSRWLRSLQSEAVYRRVSDGMTLPQVRRVLDAEGFHAGSINSLGEAVDLYYWPLPNASRYVVPFRGGRVSFFGADDDSDDLSLDSRSLRIHELVTQDVSRRQAESQNRTDRE